MFQMTNATVSDTEVSLRIRFFGCFDAREWSTIFGTSTCHSTCLPFINEEKGFPLDSEWKEEIKRLVEELVA
jgi:hypothetical protein